MLLPRSLALRDVNSPGHLLWKSSSMWQMSYQVTGLVSCPTRCLIKRQSPGETWVWHQHCYCHHAFSIQSLPILGSQIQSLWGLKSGVEVGDRNCVLPIFLVFKKYFHSFIFWGRVEVRGRLCELSLFTIWVLGIKFRLFNSAHPFFPEPPLWPL